MIGIVIPVYNLHELTDKCIDSLYELAGVDFDLLVVDNGSDIPYKTHRSAVIRNETNTGFTSAINQGIKYFNNEHEYILLLNNDIVATKDFLLKLVVAMEKDKELAITSPVRVTNINGKEVRECVGADWIMGTQRVIDKPLPEEVIYTEWIPFCCVLLRSEVVREIGLLDKRMVTYCSDAEYCMRAASMGYKVGLVPGSEVHHIKQATTGKYNVQPYDDQKVLLKIISGYYYQSFLDKLPIDSESNSWGKIGFSVQKNIGGL